MLIAILIIATLLIGVYAFFCVRHLLEFYKINIKSRGGIALNLVLTIFIMVGCVNMRSIVALVLLHILAMFGILDLISLLVRKLWKNRGNYKFYRVCRTLCRSGVVPLVVIAALFTYGYWNMQKIVPADYTVESHKIVDDYKVVLITDTHYDTIQSPNILKEKLDEINAQDADIVVLGGDIVEEGTSKQKMKEIFQLLGSIEAKYGVYYVYGNHDRQPYAQEKLYTEQELTQAITSSGIKILEDEAVELGEELILAGRGDAAWGNRSGRLTSKEILAGVDKNKFIIMADHQPIEAKENARQGVDLEISGHTHAGQIWPVGIINEHTGTLNYGKYNVDGCHVIVSSGFTGWGYPIRTSKHCEYVTIHIRHSRQK